MEPQKCQTASLQLPQWPIAQFVSFKNNFSNDQGKGGYSKRVFIIPLFS